jgi:hypothetical protein
MTDISDEFKRNPIGRIDEIVMEGDSVLDPLSYMMMISADLNCPLEQVWRVKLLPDSQIELSDFTMPKTSKNFKTTRCLNEGDIPEWINQRISVLQICEVGGQVDGVGQKVSDKVFYVIE